MLSMPKYLTASIGKKQIMALTGFGLVGFTLAHLLGNFLMFLGPDAFNMYGHKLTSNPLIYVAEAGLLGMFLAHIFLAAFLTLENKSARPVKYEMKVRTGRGETFASATMPYTGMILLVFVILHLINFKYGAHYETTVDDIVMRDLYKLVVEYFANIYYVVWYVIAMIALGIHTSHGVHSMFQSLGFNHPKYTPHLKTIALLYGLFVAVGFSSLAIFCYFQN
ncbi:MAG: cytochrome B subunit [Halobacteriovoraceae bacterium]|nr:cytochrome B subunit [Halobacteriovoraceae bacterium]|tara:strand:+ start:8384 stop:9049 length:666 start_codon:yes stop_codon:yes gene_type:complete